MEIEKQEELFDEIVRDDIIDFRARIEPESLSLTQDRIDLALLPTLLLAIREVR